MSRVFIAASFYTKLVTIFYKNTMHATSVHKDMKAHHDLCYNGVPATFFQKMVSFSESHSAVV